MIISKACLINLIAVLWVTIMIFYVKSDVLTLADKLENFRGICLNYYKLDLARMHLMK